jgi:chemotaxis protein CheD
VILPASAEGTGDPGKFAETAVDMLLENIVAAGAGRARLEAKIAGGASMFGPASSVNLGDRNTRAVRARLGEHRIPLRAEDVGGTKGRKMTLSPATGEVRVEIIGESAYTI